MYEHIHAQIARIRTEEFIGQASPERAARWANREEKATTERAPRERRRLGRIAIGTLHLRPRLH